MTPTPPPAGIEAVRAEFPDWTIEPGTDAPCWLATLRLSDTATRTVAGFSADDLRVRLLKATGSDA